MSGDDWLPVALTVGILILGVSAEIASRRHASARDDPALLPLSSGQARSLTVLLSTLACTVGAIWLIPWAMSLPLDRSLALLSGVVLLVPPLIGAIYALREIERSE
jgi:NADH:ubiquinone oxidoreductase subunit 3 (subunit A)